MKIFKNIGQISKYIDLLKSQGKSISFVPTMGCLHEGHLSLVKAAMGCCDVVIVSIFINKRQFNNVDDFKKYPKSLESDINKLQKNNVDVLFCPSDEEMDLSRHLIEFDIGGLQENLCGTSRPGHFDGVIQVINRLFEIIRPDMVIFGEKDFQQLQIVRYFILKMGLKIKVMAVDTLREEDGLAMSSRNLRLDARSRKAAARIFKSLTLIKKYLLSVDGSINLEKFLLQEKESLVKYFDKVEYIKICQESDLCNTRVLNRSIAARIFVAAYIDDVRLIDNIKLF